MTRHGEHTNDRTLSSWSAYLLRRVLRLIPRLVFSFVALAQISSAQRVVEPTGSNTETNRSPGDVFRECPECPEMVIIPGGDFMMGSSAAEKSGRQVTALVWERLRMSHRSTRSRCRRSRSASTMSRAQNTRPSCARPAIPQAMGAASTASSGRSDQGLRGSIPGSNRPGAIQWCASVGRMRAPALLG
jgi:hypothetical protein